jgi:hypothetical protein
LGLERGVEEGWYERKKRRGEYWKGILRRNIEEQI